MKLRSRRQATRAARSRRSPGSLSAQRGSSARPTPSLPRRSRAPRRLRLKKRQPGTAWRRRTRPRLRNLPPRARTSEAEALSARLAMDEAALKATGDSGAKAQALAADLTQARSDLGTASAQLAEAARNSAAAKAEAASRIASLKENLAKGSSETQAISSKLAAAEAALKAAGDSGARAQALADDLASARKALGTANAAAENAKKEEASRVATLEAELARRSSEAGSLSAKLAADEAALRSAGDSGAKAQTLAAELAQTKNDLALARSQLAQALAN